MYNTLHKLKLSHSIGRNFLTIDFLPFKLFYQLLTKVNISFKKNINGVTYKIPIYKGMGFGNLIPNYETWFDKTLQKIVPKHKEIVFIDIGANTGQTILKILPYFPKVNLYAVEPNPHCISYIQHLCSLNNFKKITILKTAFSNKKGVTKLQLRYNDDILGTTTSSFRKYTKYAFSVEVPLITGDAALTKHKNIDFIKIDVEGGESKVIEGLTETLKKFSPTIICEVLPVFVKDVEVKKFRIQSATLLFSILDKLNYTIFNIQLKQIVYNVTNLSNSLESCNYLFIPENRHSEIIDLLK